MEGREKRALLWNASASSLPASALSARGQRPGELQRGPSARLVTQRPHEALDFPWSAGAKMSPTYSFPRPPSARRQPSGRALNAEPSAGAASAARPATAPAPLSRELSASHASIASRASLGSSFVSRATAASHARPQSASRPPSQSGAPLSATLGNPRPASAAASRPASAGPSRPASTAASRPASAGPSRAAYIAPSRPASAARPTASRPASAAGSAPASRPAPLLLDSASQQELWDSPSQQEEEQVDLEASMPPSPSAEGSASSPGKRVTTPAVVQAFHETSAGLGAAADALKRALRELETEIRAEERGLREMQWYQEKLEAKRERMQKRVDERKEWLARHAEQQAGAASEESYKAVVRQVQLMYASAADFHQRGEALLQRDFNYHVPYKRWDDTFTAAPFKPK